MYSRGKFRFLSIYLGIIVIIIPLTAFAYHVEAGVFKVLLLGIALLVIVISRIIHEVKDKGSEEWSKNFGIVVRRFYSFLQSP